MKKVLFVGLFFGALALTSCKKDYTCECKYDLNGSATTHEFAIKDAKKKDAEDACKYNVPGVTVTCDLK